MGLLKSTVRGCTICAALALGCLTGSPNRLPGQGTSGPRVSDSRVGYIDSALPDNVLRVRFDSASNNRRPTRAEFFYAQGGPRGPGLPLPEPSVDYQDFSTYLEFAPVDRLSAFVDLPVRLLNPEVNANDAGFGDLNAGVKAAVVYAEDLVATFQFRTFAPTGDSGRGLGTHHVALEPALLLFARPAARVACEAELRYWVPIGGTDFEGDVIRYGLGVSYDLVRDCRVQVAPVAELVGWTVLDGLASVVPPQGTPFVEDAAGDTILNAKLGVRVRIGEGCDVYGGYGRPLTGDRWYENVFRFEFRLHF